MKLTISVLCKGVRGEPFNKVSVCCSEGLDVAEVNKVMYECVTIVGGDSIEESLLGCFKKLGIGLIDSAQNPFCVMGSKFYRFRPIKSECHIIFIE